MPLCPLGPEYHLAEVYRLAAVHHSRLANSTQNIAFWQMGQLGLISSKLISNVPSNWSIVGQRDFNGDGYTDLLWRDSTTGTVAIWFIQGFQVAVDDLARRGAK